MDKELLVAVVKETLQPMDERISKLEKSASTNEEVAKEAETPSLDTIAETIKSVVGEAIQPLSDRLETVEKARGITKAKGADDDNTEEITKSEDAWDGFFPAGF